ncbi:MAG: hypothetical protein B7Z55_13600 [Planctomycetales bacterium 12-60-4]|nr:MAG: hypothetical protein B7Z55_13600 [Planctomycetales bacterium 12-60-4]
MNDQLADARSTDSESAADSAGDESTDVGSNADEHVGELLQRGRGGANWFFWIAGLSLINTAVMHSGGDTHFVVGLGATLIVDVVAREVAAQQPDIKLVLTVVAIGFSVFCSLIAVLFGWLSRKRILILFGLGMFVYLLDGLLFLLIQDWLSLGFHGYALFCMWGGLAAYRELNQYQSPLAIAEG